MDREQWQELYLICISQFVFLSIHWNGTVSQQLSLKKQKITDEFLNTTSITLFDTLFFRKEFQRMNKGTNTKTNTRNNRINVSTHLDNSCSKSNIH